MRFWLDTMYVCMYVYGSMCALNLWESANKIDTIYIYIYIYIHTHTHTHTHRTPPEPPSSAALSYTHAHKPQSHAK